MKEVKILLWVGLIISSIFCAWYELDSEFFDSLVQEDEPKETFTETMEGLDDEIERLRKKNKRYVTTNSKS